MMGGVGRVEGGGRGAHISDAQLCPVVAEIVVAAVWVAAETAAETGAARVAAETVTVVMGVSGWWRRGWSQ